MSRGDLLVTLDKSLAGRSRSSFALAVFYVQVRNCFLLLVMRMRVVSGKSKPMRVVLRTGILGLRVPMDDILF
jgi:fluoride ion exporter CrcB/FEX